jgi:hypothetical protein
MVKTDANNSKCDAIFYTTAENVRNGMMRSFDATENVVTGELFNKMTNLKAVVNNNTAEIRNANEAKTFADAVKVAFDADKSSTTPSNASATQSSATSNETNTSATQSSVTPSSVSSETPSNTSAAQSNTSATPSATNATIPNETSAINAKNANLNNMPVMQQPPEAVAKLSEVAVAAGGG